jgi:hypothetical protein
LDSIVSNEVLRNQFKNGAIRIAEAWSALEGVRRASVVYVSEGLLRGVLSVETAQDYFVETAQDYLVELVLEIEDAIDGIGDTAKKPRSNESLWNWHCRNTGEWLGSATDSTY